MGNMQELTPYETREILFYKTDNGEVRVEILLFQENLWLTQAKMAELFEVQKAAISKHLKNIFESGELNEDAVVSKMETTAGARKLFGQRLFRRSTGTYPGHPGQRAKVFPENHRHLRTVQRRLRCRKSHHKGIFRHSTE